MTPDLTLLSSRSVAEPLGLRSPIGRRSAIYLFLATALVAVFLLELMIGAVHVPLPDVVKALLGGHTERLAWDRIVLQLRLPRAINALFSGVALGACGLLLQTLFRNPLADPFVLGTVQGARLGVAVLVVLAGAAGDLFSTRFGLFGDFTMATGAAIGSTALMLVLMTAAKKVGSVTLLILGLMLGYLCEGLVSVVLHFTDEVQAGVFDNWSDGSYAGATFQQLAILIPLVIAGVVVVASLGKPLNGLLLGEDYARSLGIAVARVRIVAFAITAVLIGAVTAYSGPIAFVGLVVAQTARGIFRTSDHRVLIPASVLLGAVLALTTDLVTHLPWSRHFLHLNAVNGLVGAPVVIWVILQHRRSRAAEL